MLRYREADPLPEVCQHCEEPECDECDHFTERFLYSELDLMRATRKGYEQAIRRFERKIAEADKKILELEEKERTEPPVDWLGL